MQAFLVFIAALATDFALVRWTTAAARSRPLPAAAWSVVVAGLGLIGLGGALGGGLPLFAYLAGNAVGSFLAAYLGQRSQT